MEEWCIFFGAVQQIIIVPLSRTDLHHDGGPEQELL